MKLEDVAGYATIASIPLTIVLWLVTREHFMAFWKKWAWLIKTTVVLLTLIGLVRLGWLDWIANRVTVPVYVLIIVLALLLGSVWLVARFVKYMASSSPSQPWLTYVSDNLFGVDWNWQYHDGQLTAYGITALCPKPSCRCRLSPQRSSMYDAIKEIGLVCQNCGFQKDFDCDWETLERRVLIEVERRIRTGQYGPTGRALQGF